MLPRHCPPGGRPENRTDVGCRAEPRDARSRGSVGKGGSHAPPSPAAPATCPHGLCVCSRLSLCLERRERLQTHWAPLYVPWARGTQAPAAAPVRMPVLLGPFPAGRAWLLPGSRSSASKSFSSWLGFCLGSGLCCVSLGSGWGGLPQTTGHPLTDTCSTAGPRSLHPCDGRLRLILLFPSLPLLVTYLRGIAACQIEAALLPQAWFWAGERWSPKEKGQEARTLQGRSAFTVLPPAVP